MTRVSGSWRAENESLSFLTQTAWGTVDSLRCCSFLQPDDSRLAARGKDVLALQPSAQMLCENMAVQDESGSKRIVGACLGFGEAVDAASILVPWWRRGRRRQHGVYRRVVPAHSAAGRQTAGAEGDGHAERRWPRTPTTQSSAANAGVRRRAQREKHVRLVCTVVFWICMSSQSFHMAGADPELRSSVQHLPSRGRHEKAQRF